MTRHWCPCPQVQAVSCRLCLGLPRSSCIAGRRASCPQVSGTPPQPALALHNRAVTMTFPLLHHSGSALVPASPSCTFLRTKQKHLQGCLAPSACQVPAKGLHTGSRVCPSGGPGSPPAALGIWGSSRNCRSSALLARKAGRHCRVDPCALSSWDVWTGSGSLGWALVLCSACSECPS